jgi:hypothetical protein
MRRTRSPNRPALAPSVSRLIRLATEWSECSSQLENAYWRREVTPEVDALLETGDEKAITSVLDQLWTRNAAAHDLIADLIEARAESTTLDLNGTPHDVMLLAVPVLAWSRDRIPAGKLTQKVVTQVAAQLSAHVLAKAARIELTNALFSPDQLPHQYSESYELAHSMFRSLAAGSTYKVDFSGWPETGQFVADTRLLLAAVAVPAGGALFRWQEEDITREKALVAWREHGVATLQAAMPGCVLELLLPSAFHAGSRAADREGRGFSLKAGVQFLESVASLSPREMVAVVAPFYDRELEEYRISLMRANQPEVLHGVVWPVLGPEVEEDTVSDEIEAILKALGVSQVIQLDQKFPLEHCSDCGAPMFADSEGELIHAGFPEDDAPEVVRYH